MSKIFNSRYRVLFFVNFFFVFTIQTSVFSQYAVPQLPDVSSVEVCPPDTAGYSIITVGPVGRDYTSFQDALNNAQLGTVIVLDAGESFIGNYTLPNITSGITDGWIIITGSRTDLLSDENTRIEPDSATGDGTFPYQQSALPKIISDNNAPAISSAPSANHYRFIGVEVAYTLNANGMWNLIMIGDNYSNFSDIPQQIVFDRCYIHGCDSIDATRGIFLNANNAAVIHCNISNFHQHWYDTQAIAVCWANGPFVIYDNFLSATGEIIMFGGGGPPLIYGIIPSNIEIKNNHLYKPLSWYAHDSSYAGVNYMIKSNFEIKSAQKVLFEGNIIENQWPGNGHKYCINAQAATGQSGSWVQTNDITIINNILKNCVGGMNVGRNYSEGSLDRILFENNLIFNMSSYYGYENGYGLMTPFAIFAVADSINNVTINHNTVLNEDKGSCLINILSTFGKPSPNLYFNNNIVFHGPYGILGDGTSSGYNTFDSYFPPYNSASYNQRFTNNVIVNNTHNTYAPGSYPTTNFFSDTTTLVGFVDYPNGITNYSNYALANISPYKSMATDGADIGVNIQLINNAMNPAADPYCPILTDIESDFSPDKVIFYPNPTSDQLTITINELKINGCAILKVYNCLGLLISIHQLTNLTTVFNCKEFYNGVYYFTLDNGKSIFHSKFIVNK